MTSIYLDNAATTQVDPRVCQDMARVLLDEFGNPSSRHPLGLVAERHVRDARQVLARALSVDAQLVHFTSGGTEALGHAILGTVRLKKRPSHLLISAIEHPATLETAAIAAELGHTVEAIPCEKSGAIDPAAIAQRLRPETALVAVMHVNNETGVVQPIEAIAERIKERAPSCRLLVDAVQSFSKIDIKRVARLADLVAVSAHKIHGPKGVGALIRKSAKTRLAPLWGGGDQELGLRPGTENVAGIVGFGRAISCIAEDGALALDPASVARMHRHAEGLRQALVDAGLRRPYLVGDGDLRAPHIVAIASSGLPAEVMINALGQRGLIVSSGSACHSRKSLRSHVLSAMAIPREQEVLRFSFSRATSDEEIASAKQIIVEALGPLVR